MDLNQITETQATQIELDKTAQDFKQLHHERQQLLDQWFGPSWKCFFFFVAFPPGL